NVRTQSVLTRDLLDTLPTSRGYQAFTALTLAATSAVGSRDRDVGGSRGEGILSVRVHGGDNGLTTVDGNQIGSTNYPTTHRYSFNQLAVQEVALQTSGSSAESIAGFTVNMVPKDGGNTFSAAYNGDYSDHHLEGNNLSDELRERGLTNANSAKKVYDQGFTLGGPIAKNKLWFFTAHRWWGGQQ